MKVKLRVINTTIQSCFSYFQGGNRKGGRWNIGHPQHYKHCPKIFIEEKEVKWDEINGFKIISYRGGIVNKLVPIYTEEEWENVIAFILGGHRETVYPPTLSQEQKEFYKLVEDFNIKPKGLYDETKYAKHFWVGILPFNSILEFSYCGPRTGWYSKTQRGVIIWKK